MKKYEKPTVQVIALETFPILAGSVGTVNNQYSTSSQLSREFDFDLEDEEDF